MIDPDKLQAAVDRGGDVLHRARETRAALRRRTKRSSQRRQSRIEAALFEIDDVMKVLRSYVAKTAYHDFPPDLERQLRETSAALQGERRRLKKMR